MGQKKEENGYNQSSKLIHIFIIKSNINHNLKLQTSKAGKIRTESGAWIPATYKSNRYAQWKERNKTDHVDDDNNDSENEHPKGLK